MSDECEDVDGTVAESGWYVNRRCGCSTALCNDNSGSDGAPYLSLTMIIVIIASFAFSQ